MQSRDEVFEWACDMTRTYGYNPMYYIGSIDTYMSFSKSLKEAMMKIEDRVKGEIENGKEKTEL